MLSDVEADRALTGMLPVAGASQPPSRGAEYNMGTASKRPLSQEGDAGTPPGTLQAMYRTKISCHPGFCVSHPFPPATPSATATLTMLPGYRQSATAAMIMLHLDIKSTVSLSPTARLEDKAPTQAMDTSKALLWACSSIAGKQDQALG